MKRTRIIAAGAVAIVLITLLALVIVCVTVVGRILWTKPEEPEITDLQGSLVTPTAAAAAGGLYLPGRTAEGTVIFTYRCEEPHSGAGMSALTDEEEKETERKARIYALKTQRWQESRQAAEEPAEEPAEPEIVEELPYTEDELRLLAITIYCEAGSDSISDETRRMVGEVVLNRVDDERFPDTIEGVLTQRSQYGRFYWTGVVLPSRAASEPEAVDRAYECARLVFTEERLLPTDVVFQAEFRQGKECVVHVPGFYFCR